jgi:hypothetical protein
MIHCTKHTGKKKDQDKIKGHQRKKDLKQTPKTRSVHKRKRKTEKRQKRTQRDSDSKAPASLPSLKNVHIYEKYSLILQNLLASAYC